MEDDDVALSEVHLTEKKRKDIRQNELGYSVCITEFKFNLLEEESLQSFTDDDGDLVVVREREATKIKGSISIVHSLETRISDVGLQVWPGCILLCDYILSHQNNFKGKTILEFGSGIGLASVVSATVAKYVIATDTGEEVLNTCKNNIHMNNHLLEIFGRLESIKSIVTVKEWNWIDSVPKQDGLFGWRENELQVLSEVEVIIAADVVYDDKLTDALFARLNQLLQVSSKCVYISVEKRLNFTLDDMDVVCPAYNHFKDCLNQLEKSSYSERCITVMQIDTDFPEIFYEFARTQYTELWKITSAFPSKE